MLVVNMLGGPGAGKTYAAWNLAAELKKRGLVVEYVPEYAKELVWENRLDKLKDQEALFHEQFRRLNRLNGKVDVAITDSPLILNLVYGKNNSETLVNDIYNAVDRFENFNVMVRRGNERYEPQGRVQSLEESKAIDRSIERLLYENNMYYGTYAHSRLFYLSENIEKTIDRLNEQPITADKLIQLKLERYILENDHTTLTDFAAAASDEHFTGDEIRHAIEYWKPVSEEEKAWLDRYNEHLFHNSNKTTYLLCSQKSNKSLLFSLSITPQPWIVATGLQDTSWASGKYFTDFDSANNYFRDCFAKQRRTEETEDELEL